METTTPPPAPTFRDPLAVDLGKLIRAKREERDWTQVEFATGLGVSQVTVSRWESGERYPSIGHLKALARTLEFSDRQLQRYALREAS